MNLTGSFCDALELRSPFFEAGALSSSFDTGVIAGKLLLTELTLIFGLLDLCAAAAIYKDLSGR